MYADGAARLIDPVASRLAQADWSDYAEGDQTRLLREIARWAELQASRRNLLGGENARRLAHYANVGATMLQFVVTR